MTQSINKYDFSQAPDPKGLAEFNAKKAINNAFKDAPVVATLMSVHHYLSDGTCV